MGEDVRSDADELARSYQRRLKSAGREKLPKCLYRYVSIANDERRGWLRETLLDSTLFFGPFHGLNDPHEGKIVPEFSAPPEVVEAYWRRFAEENPSAVGASPQERIAELVEESKTEEGRKKHQELVATLIGEYGVCSLSERGDSLPMWAYYAANQCGVCLRFPFTGKLIDWVFVDRTLLAVTYSKEYPHIDFYGASIEARIKAMIATKSVEWQHEVEWRMVATRKQGKHAFPPDLIDAVLVGAKAAEADVAWVKMLATQRPVPTEVYRVVTRPDTFELEVIPV